MATAFGRYDLPTAWPAPSMGYSREGLIVPRKTCEVLARILKGAGGSLVQIATNETATKVSFSGDGWHLVSKVIDGTFPDYTRVMPQGAPTASFMLAADELPPAPRGRVALAVKLDADAGQMSWAAGDTVASRDILADGAGAIGFNARYLADFAKAAPDGLTIEAFDAGAPARVITSDARFVGIVMPMRV